MKNKAIHMLQHHITEGHFTYRVFSKKCSSFNFI
jgi:hypothetical protein